jgi:hypothetical protein
VGPAVLIHSVGQGTVLTFAGSPDFATASEHHIVEARKLFANAVRLLHPNPRVRVTAPANVEAVVTDDPATRTLRVHLIAYNATPQTTPAKDRPYVLPGLIEDVPMFRATLELPGGLKSAKALNRTTQLKNAASGSNSSLRTSTKSSNAATDPGAFHCVALSIRGRCALPA